jgi:PPM family protein phosphatase
LHHGNDRQILSQAQINVKFAKVTFMLEKTKALSQIHGCQLDRGIKRDTNEDCLSVTESLQMSEGREYSLGIYVITDGIAGMAYGERASRIAARVASQVFLQQFQIHEPMTQACEFWLKSATEMAHEVVQASNKIESGCQSGTTIVMAVVLDNHVYISNVGDSRAYIISNDEMRQVSQDHTMANLLVKAGVLSPDEAKKSSQRNRLSQALGIVEAVNPSLHNEKLYGGDLLLLCSDGLYSKVDDETILQIIKDSHSPQIACETLVQAANDAGGDDNISVILVQLQGN